MPAEQRQRICFRPFRFDLRRQRLTVVPPQTTRHFLVNVNRHKQKAETEHRRDQRVPGLVVGRLNVSGVTATGLLTRLSAMTGTCAIRATGPRFRDA